VYSSSSVISQSRCPKVKHDDAVGVDEMSPPFMLQQKGRRCISETWSSRVNGGKIQSGHAISENCSSDRVLQLHHEML